MSAMAMFHVALQQVNLHNGLFLSNRRRKLVHLENVLLRGQAKLLASNGEGDIWQLRQLVAVNNSLTAA